jgi:hypothetical protein
MIGCMPRGPFHKEIGSPAGSLEVEIHSKKLSYQSGRPDLNRRPLDPQSHASRRRASPKRADWALEQPKQWLSVAGCGPGSACVGSWNGYATPLSLTGIGSVDWARRRMGKGASPRGRGHPVAHTAEDHGPPKITDHHAGSGRSNYQGIIPGIRRRTILSDGRLLHGSVIRCIVASANRTVIGVPLSNARRRSSLERIIGQDGIEAYAAGPLAAARQCAWGDTGVQAAIGPTRRADGAHESAAFAREFLLTQPRRRQLGECDAARRRGVHARRQLHGAHCERCDPVASFNGD